MSTLAELQTRRQAYLDAEVAILKSQEYQVGDGSTARRNKRADLAEVRAAIADLDAQIQALQPVAQRTAGPRILYIR